MLMHEMAVYLTILLGPNKEEMMSQTMGTDIVIDTQFDTRVVVVHSKAA